ncbi:MAG: Methionyl-tRNA synthetase [Candidatus Moranbacteria bacterium GW2011_GWA2_39_41]|nr:MAG: Methionyl-tRNA synthetase [Candidatus Moranbacteria bacterium GW2011_GWA2_39_41]
MKNKFYITTTLPYVNANPHIGFALEIVQADVVARFHRQLGDEVFFNTGTDEHGAKVHQKALELGKDAQKYCDEKAQNFLDLKKMLNLSFDSFTRTTDAHHIAAAQEFWQRCETAGDIYKKNYKIKYCVGCELEKTESDLVDGKCPLHPNMEIEIIDEENYFFRFSKYQERLLEFYANNSTFVTPDKKFNEVKSFVAMGLQDFSISRLKNKMPWGVEVPGDPEQVMYVWFDALVNYISAIGWPDNLENFEQWWPAVQLAGKDNLRQQSAMWQAMLFSAGIPNSKQVFINGFVNVGGQKMSKSLGNVVSPQDLIEKFGIDATRYLLLTLGDNFGEDMDFTWERVTEKYNADLANGLGNITSRIIKLAEGLDIPSGIKSDDAKNADMRKMFAEMELSQALQIVWSMIRENDKYISDTKPWELRKTDEVAFKKIMQKLLSELSLIAELLVPFMPDTAEKIKKALETKQVEIIFPRITPVK